MPIQVAVAVIKNSQGEILIAKRKLGTHMGGKWEFPGGKVEPGETTQQALYRELLEELDISIGEAQPLIKIQYAYPDKTVLLDVCCLDAYTGVAKGNEGQEIKWCDPGELMYADFPEANVPIINAIKLPDYYFITPDLISGSDQEYLHVIKCVLQNGIDFIQLRCPQYSDQAYLKLAEQAQCLCVSMRAKLILNRAPIFLSEVSADGVHLNSSDLHTYKKRPVAVDKWLSASCHTKDDIVQSNRINADYISLSPVRKTLSHPNAPALGWGEFQSLSLSAGIPVYALGGMSCNDVMQARSYGGRGIAAIRAFLV